MVEKDKACPDSAGLGCEGNKKITVGYVDEVNHPLLYGLRKVGQPESLEPM